jgi:hypothetical protein
MNKTERQELTIAIKAKTKAARMMVAQRKAEVIAHVEKQLAAVYKADHELWSDITEEAQRAVAEADRQIAAICREKGIPENFRPSLNIYWSGRGENASKERRRELRDMLYAEIDAQAMKALAFIESKLADFQIKLAATALESEEAREMFAALPTIEDLLPLRDIDPRRLRLSVSVTDDETDDDEDVTYASLRVVKNVTPSRDTVTPSVTAPNEEKACPVCGKPVEASRSDATTCSPACRQKLWRQSKRSE